MTYEDENRAHGQALPVEGPSEATGVSDMLCSEAGDEGAETERLYARVSVALSDESFRELVVKDAKGKVYEEEKAFLRSPSVVGRWNSVLGSLNRELQSQFAERRAEAQSYRNECMKAGPKAKQDWFDYQARYESWRGGATRFKGLVEERLTESKDLIREQKAVRRRAAGRATQRVERRAGGAEEEGDGAAGAMSSLPLLSDVAELLSKEGAVREPFAAQRDWLLKRISETFHQLRGRSVAEEAACASSGAGASTQADSRQGQANEHNDARGGEDG